MSNMIVFKDSHQADGLEKGVKLVNQLLEQHELKVNLQFIQDFISDDEGELGCLAYCVSIVPDDLPDYKEEKKMSEQKVEYILQSWDQEIIDALYAALYNLIERKLIVDTKGDHMEEIAEAMAKARGDTEYSTRCPTRHREL